MYRHIKLGDSNFARQRALFLLIKTGKIQIADYQQHKIYGTLDCSSGKRMKIENRVFFANEQEALSDGYRPCGRCMPEKYKLWKLKNGSV
jgi:methylphosphotriester-DNA--protein-cysteine methyltransferase